MPEQIYCRIILHVDRDCNPQELGRLLVAELQGLTLAFRRLRNRIPRLRSNQLNDLDRRNTRSVVN